MFGLLLVAALSTQARAECGDIAVLVDRAEQAVLEGRLPDAGATLRQAEISLGCGRVPEPALLGRMWLAEGTRAFLQGDVKVARLAFGAAMRVAPGLWVESYGAQIHTFYMDSREEGQAPGTIRLHPDPAGWTASLDGSPSAFPVQVSPGLHLVQVGTSQSSTAYAEILNLPAGQTYMVLTGLAAPAEPAVVVPEPAPPEPAAPEAAPPEPIATATAPGEPVVLLVPPDEDRAASPVFLVLGGVAAVAAGATAAVALSQDPKLEDAATVDSLDRIYARQQAFGYSSYGLMGLAAACVGLHFAVAFTF